MLNLIEKANAAIDFSGLKLKTTTQDFSGLANSITTTVGTIAAIVAFFFLVYSGFLYLTAGGNAESAKKGQQGILYAIIGLVIIALAWWIVSASISTTNNIS